MTTSLAALVPIIVLVLAPCLLVKLSAVILRIKVRWPWCLGFGFGVACLTVLNGFVMRAVGVTLGAPMGLVLGAGIMLAGGGAYFGSRATDRHGALIGFKGGVRMMIVYLLLLAVLFLVQVAVTVNLARERDSESISAVAQPVRGDC